MRYSAKHSSVCGAVALSMLAYVCMPSFAGTDPAAFLNTGVGARALAMGSAYVSVADDTTSMYWNPAGLGKITRISFAGMSQSLGSAKWDTLKDIAPQYQFFGITYPLQRNDAASTARTIGVGMISNSLSNIPLTTVDENGVISRDTLEDSEKAYFISYGFPVFKESDTLLAGGTFKYITQSMSKIDGATAAGYDFDFGVMYRLGTLNLGLVLQRGIELKWANGRSDTGGLATKMGASGTMWSSGSFSLLGSGDVVQRQDQPLTLNAGTELTYSDGFTSQYLTLSGLSLRLGLEGYVLEDRFGYRSKMNANNNVTAGVGINLLCFGYKVQVDYAIGMYQLGDKNRISLNLYF